MRNQPLTGYVLHQKPYGENRSLIYFFSQELGLVHGIGKKNLPLFYQIQLFATGKNSLKTFSQSQIIYQNNQQIFSRNHGKSNLAGLYINELLLRIFGISNVEDATPNLWQQYAQTINAIFLLFQDDNQNDKWRLHFYLRHFETVLLNELGYAIDFSQDNLQNSIEKTCFYHYQLEQGFCFSNERQKNAILGENLLIWQNLLDNPQTFDEFFCQNLTKTPILLTDFAKIYRNILDNLLNYQPLKSRELWQQMIKYQ
ncbi:DNA repair protein RecO [Faucicola mancuniensis]|uniref:DNA repair protein RecO n=1 Tax=Faucicola mancuniensis TaxID=1309795 RepID=UPI0028E8DA13|nr:DNA repair protein RecO C-terminal domain-containing protein [uncultured Moraxella sp.]